MLIWIVIVRLCFTTTSLRNPCQRIIQNCHDFQVTEVIQLPSMPTMKHVLKLPSVAFSLIPVSSMKQQPFLRSVKITMLNERLRFVIKLNLIICHYLLFNSSFGYINMLSPNLLRVSYAMVICFAVGSLSLELYSVLYSDDRAFGTKMPFEVKPAKFESAMQMHASHMWSTDQLVE